MLRPFIHRLTLTAVLLGTVLGAGALFDATVGNGAALASSPSAPPRHEGAPADVAEVAQAARQTSAAQGPNRRWPFFSFGTAGGKRSW
jgi:hypothetical protein